METPIQINNENYYLPGGSALITFARQTPEVTDRAGNGGKEMRIKYGKNNEAKIRTWGKNNLLPQEREALVLDNNIVPELMATKRDITVGGGLMCYREVFENGTRRIEEVEMPIQARAFFQSLPEMNGGQDIEAFLLKSCRNLIYHANVFTEFVRDLGGKIKSIKAHECRHLRPEWQDATGKIPNWFWSGNWKDQKKG